MKKILVKKISMSQVWKNNTVIPVTLLTAVNPKLENLFEGLEEGDKVKIRGVSKGKGFQGVVKRHGFHGGPATHGQKDRHRAPGSNGPTAPQRTLKGRKMAGHTGNRKVSIQNISVVTVSPTEGNIMLQGAVPGMRGTLIEIRK